MAEQYIPTASEIERRMWFRMLGQNIPYTDLSVIAALRIFMREAMVEEFVALWNGLSRSTRAWFFQTATGDELDRRLRDFGLTRPSDGTGTGELTVGADSSGATVPSGTIAKTSPSDPDIAVQRYVVRANPDTVDGSWAISASATTKILIEAQQAGEGGNTPANTIVGFENNVAHVTSVTNELAIVDGTNVTDDYVRQYFKDWLGSLSGGTRGAILWKVVNYIDPVTGAKPIHSVALEEWDGNTLLSGNVALRVWIEDGSGSASATLLAAIQAMLDGQDTEAAPGIRSAGVPSVVAAARPVNVPVDVDIDVDRSVGAEVVRAATQTAIERFLAAIPVSGKKITGDVQGQVIFAQLFRAVMNVPGVLRATFRRPTTNMVLQTGQKAMPGEVSVTVLSVT